MVKKLLLVFLLLIAWILPAYALENVTGMVRAVYGPPVFDSATQKYYLDVTLQNISKKNSLEFPLRLLVTSLSQSKASVYQPDGINEDKMPYYLFFQSDKKLLAPGESVGTRKIFFSDLKPGKLNFTSLVQLSTVESTANNFLSALQMSDVNYALKELDDKAQIKYGEALNRYFDSLQLISQGYIDKKFIYINDVMAKCIIIFNEDGMKVAYDIYLYKNSQGEWKISKF